MPSTVRLARAPPHISGLLVRHEDILHEKSGDGRHHSARERASQSCRGRVENWSARLEQLCRYILRAAMTPLLAGTTCSPQLWVI